MKKNNNVLESEDVVVLYQRTPGYQWKTNKYRLPILWVPVIVLLVMPIITGIGKAEPSESIWEVLGNGLPELRKVLPMWITIFIMALISTYIIRKGVPQPRLLVGKSGMSYISGLPKFFPTSGQDWTMRWDEIQNINIVNHTGSIDLVALIFKTKSLNRHLVPFQWHRTSGPAHSDVGIGAWRRSRAEPRSMQRQLAGLPLVAILREKVPSVNIDRVLESLESPFPTFKKKSVLAVLAIFFGLIIWMLVDGRLYREAYAQEPTEIFPFFVVAGAIAAVISAKLMRSDGVTKTDSIAASVGLGIVVAMSCYPFSLHVNRLTGSAGLFSYGYRVIYQKPAVILEPINPGLPKIDYFGPHDYWRRFSEKDVIPVNVRKGGLGLWQFDPVPIFEDIDRYHNGSRETRWPKYQ